jgi:hypothetical protein
MPSTVLFVLLFLQARGPDESPTPGPQNSLAVRRVMNLAPPMGAAHVQHQDAAYRQTCFVNRFNRLVQALAEFSEKYNQEHSIDVKKVKAIQKAWHEMEKSDSWIRRDKAP